MIGLTFLIFAALVNLVGFWVISSWVRWINLALGLVFSLMLFAVAYSNIAAGCFWAEKDVEFTQGMTLCPGQTAHGSIIFKDVTIVDLK